jgi:DnaK suppressor protein
LNPTELQRYKELLLAKRREVSDLRVRTGAPVPAAGVPRGDVVDQAVADSEAEIQVRLRETDGRLLRAIDEALNRIGQKSYGLCESCGQPIGSARLNAVPWTRLCKDCKEQRQD